LEEASECDITIEQGLGFTLPLRYEAPEGSPVDFTGSTARMQVRPKFGSPMVLIELTTDRGIELGSDGSIVLTRAPDVTAALTFSHDVYDLEMTPSAGRASHSQGVRSAPPPALVPAPPSSPVRAAPAGPVTPCPRPRLSPAADQPAAHRRPACPRRSTRLIRHRHSVGHAVSLPNRPGGSEFGPRFTPSQYDYLRLREPVKAERRAR
jgi:hypothetical protein